MPNVNDLKQSRFLTKRDVDPPILVTIKGYEQRNVARERDEPDMRYVLYFQEDYKPMTLNITNGRLIAAITGSEDLDDWIGHKIVVFFDPAVDFGGELVGGIRCRAPRVRPTLSAEDKAAEEVIDSLGDSVDEPPALPTPPLRENPNLNVVEKQKKYTGEGNVPPTRSEQESDAPF